MKRTSYLIFSLMIGLFLSSYGRIGIQSPRNLFSGINYKAFRKAPLSRSIIKRSFTTQRFSQIRQPFKNNKFSRNALLGSTIIGLGFSLNTIHNSIKKNSHDSSKIEIIDIKSLEDFYALLESCPIEEIIINIAINTMTISNCSFEDWKNIKEFIQKSIPEKKSDIVKGIIKNFNIIAGNNQEGFWKDIITPLFESCTTIQKEELANAIQSQSNLISSNKSEDLWQVFLPHLLESDINEAIKIILIDTFILHLNNVLTNAKNSGFGQERYFPTIVWQYANNNQRETIVKHLADNIIILTTIQDIDIWNRFLVPLFKDSKDSAKEMLIDAISIHIPELSTINKRGFWYDFLNSIVHANKKYEQKIIYACIHHLDTIFQNNRAFSWLLPFLHELDKAMLKTCIEKFQNNAHLLSEDMLWQLIPIYQHDEEALNHLFNKLNPTKKELTSTNGIKFKHLIKYASCKQLLNFYAQHNIEPIGLMLMHAFKDNCACSTNNCPTLQHIKNNKKIVTQQNASNKFYQYITDPLLQEFIMKIIIKEQDLNNQGYATFYHGQNWEYDLLLEWYTKIWTLRHNQENKKTKDFIFGHARSYCKNQECYDKEHAMQKRLINNNMNKYNFVEYFKEHQYLLFTNYAFFANSSRMGSSTGYYFYENSNADRKRDILLRDIFEWFDLECIYNKFKEKFDILQEKHKNLETYGNLLMYAIPKEQLDNQVYECRPGGRASKKFQESTFTKTLERLKSPTKPTSWLFFSDNTDKREFCIPMTQNKDGALNPESGIKVFSFNAADQTAYAQYKEQEAQLWQEVKEAIAQKQKKADTKTTI